MLATYSGHPLDIHSSYHGVIKSGRTPVIAAHCTQTAQPQHRPVATLKMHPRKLAGDRSCYRGPPTRVGGQRAGGSDAVQTIIRDRSPRWNLTGSDPSAGETTKVLHVGTGIAQGPHHGVGEVKPLQRRAFSHAHHVDARRFLREVVGSLERKSSARHALRWDGYVNRTPE